MIYNQYEGIRALKNLFALLFLGVVMLFCQGRPEGIGSICTENIESITVTSLETGQSRLCTVSEIEAFTEAMGCYKLYRNDVGTTLPYRADVLFTDGAGLQVWGDAHSFGAIDSQSIRQQNILCSSLGQWFASLEIAGE